jgi:DNA-binding GntR family transcriptional regulator
VSDLYFKLKEENGAEPSQQALAEAAKVSRDTAKKTMEEINVHRRVLNK